MLNSPFIRARLYLGRAVGSSSYELCNRKWTLCPPFEVEAFEWQEEKMRDDCLSNCKDQKCDVHLRAVLRLRFRRDRLSIPEFLRESLATSFQVEPRLVIAVASNPHHALAGDHDKNQLR